MTEWDSHVHKLRTGSEGIIDALEGQSPMPMDLDDLKKEVSQKYELSEAAISGSLWHLIGNGAIRVKNVDASLSVQLVHPDCTAAAN